MNTELMFSSKTDLHETPIAFFNKLKERYDFDLDVCADENNFKCKNYFTKEQDGLSKDWNQYTITKQIWMNPPYGREIGKWIKKAYNESLNGVRVVCLLPARTDTKWFHDYCQKVSITFIKGRLKFGGAKFNAPFPNMIVIF